MGSSHLSGLLNLSGYSLRLVIRLVSCHAAEYASLEPPVRRSEVDFPSHVEESEASGSTESDQSLQLTRLSDQAIKIPADDHLDCVRRDVICQTGERGTSLP